MLSPSRHEIWKMFDRISATYDKINRVVSLGKDRSWRKALVKHLPQNPGLKLLDVATGTADQLIVLLEESEQIERAIGIDLSQDMLQIAARKLETKSYRERVSLQRADAETLPFASRMFDVTTLSFGIRNVSSPEKALQELHRVLKPKGKALILEFSLPPYPIRPVYLWYLRHLMPWIGGLFSKNREAYRYLNETIETFPYGKEFALLMKQTGFSRIEIHPMALGAVSLYVGTKS